MTTQSPTSTEIKALWKKHGGEQHGPMVEHYSIEEQAFYRFARDLLALRTPPATGEGEIEQALAEFRNKHPNIPIARIMPAKRAVPLPFDDDDDASPDQEVERIVAWLRSEAAMNAFREETCAEDMVTKYALYRESLNGAADAIERGDYRLTNQEDQGK